MWPEEELRSTPMQRALLSTVQDRKPPPFGQRLGSSSLLGALRQATSVRKSLVPAAVPQRPLPAVPGDHLHRLNLRMWKDLGSTSDPLWHSRAIVPASVLGYAALRPPGNPLLPFRRVPALHSSGDEGMHRRPCYAEEHSLRFKRHPVQSALQQDPAVWNPCLYQALPPISL